MGAPVLSLGGEVWFGFGRGERAWLTGDGSRYRGMRHMERNPTSLERI